MDPLETLRNEHGLIRQFLDNLVLASEMIERGENPPRKFFDMSVDFARRFADTYHHFKEEYQLFNRLAEKQSGDIDGQIQKLRDQHERGRDHVNAIAGVLDGYEARDSIKTETLLKNITDYTALLREHIHTEDHVFYPMAREQLSQEEMSALSVEFDNARVKSGENTFEECHKLIVDMGSIVAHL